MSIAALQASSLASGSRLSGLRRLLLESIRMTFGTFADFGPATQKGVGSRLSVLG